MLSLTPDDFFKRCKKIHNDFYDYSISEFIGTNKKIRIICPEHGIFEQRADNHMKGQKCIYCSNKRWNIEKFVNISNKIHHNKYDYSSTIYKNAHTKVKIICSEHGMFEQIPWNHISESAGCPYCAENRTTLEIFKSKSNWKHNNKYDYSLITEYKNSKEKVKIVCPEHGIFEQMMASHQHGQGCPICTETKGEQEIRHFFELNQIKFIQYKKYKTNKTKNHLEFDFYLEKFNCCIEFDGIQHFEPVKWFGGKKSLIQCQHRDKIKNIFCEENNIKLLRIKYDENIEEKLKLFLINIISQSQDSAKK